ncbi:Retrotransposon-derived protein PEG10 [Smittium mucronatum]|uniref:Retrotransposon-derived protein PEG10 n=1 Tax=Smittium mucronatum TaxID=133383 RepID=A0A1R0H6E0_9FUNG|nr:Retrotransposon-derived protein PEG10 [Smittium mucronatum]
MRGYSLPNIPVVLGLPWIKLHSPNVHWKKNSIQFESEFCKINCVQTTREINANFGSPEDYDSDSEDKSDSPEILAPDPEEIFDTIPKTSIPPPDDHAPQMPTITNDDVLEEQDIIPQSSPNFPPQNQKSKTDKPPHILKSDSDKDPISTAKLTNEYIRFSSVLS